MWLEATKLCVCKFFRLYSIVSRELSIAHVCVRVHVFWMAHKPQEDTLMSTMFSLPW